MSPVFSSNICSLSESGSSTISNNAHHPTSSLQRAAIPPFVVHQGQPASRAETSRSKRATVECAWCAEWVKESELKWHIWVQHFPWYQTVRCAKCRLKMPNEEIFRTRHPKMMKMPGHDEVFG